jgi:hypothetical protein
VWLCSQSPPILSLLCLFWSAPALKPTLDELELADGAIVGFRLAARGLRGPVLLFPALGVGSALYSAPLR